MVDTLPTLAMTMKKTNYENSLLYIKDLKSGETKTYATDLDRSLDSVTWAANSRGVYVSYDNEGKTTLAYQPLKGRFEQITDAIGSVSFGRPYSGGDYAISDRGLVAFTLADPLRPADVAIVKRGEPRPITALNEDALGDKTLATVEEVWLKSKHDQLPIQAWVAYSWV